MKRFYRIKFVPYILFALLKKISPNFGPKIFGLKLEKLAEKNFLLSKVGIGNKLYFIKFIIEKILSVQWFHFRKRGFVIFLTGATQTDFFEIGRWNFMTIVSKPHIPFLWRIFLRLGSSSPCCDLSLSFSTASCILFLLIFKEWFFGSLQNFEWLLSIVKMDPFHALRYQVDL